MSKVKKVQPIKNSVPKTKEKTLEQIEQENVQQAFETMQKFQQAQLLNFEKEYLALVAKYGHEIQAQLMIFPKK